MIVSVKSKYLILILCLIGATSCNDAEQQQNKEQLKAILGAWQLTSAIRDGSPTSSLDKTYFEFKETGVMISNFNLGGLMEEKKFELSPGLIVQHGVPHVEYLIKNLTNNQLRLETNYSGANFILVLEKDK